jgi:putative tricarboxylic transport membrane protein
VFYIAASDWLGFVPTAFVIMAVLLRAFGCGLATTLVVALATTIGVQELFARALLVPLPWGLLQPVAW